MKYTLHFQDGPWDGVIITSAKPIELVQVIEYHEDGSNRGLVTIYELDKEAIGNGRHDLYYAPLPFDGRI